MAIRTIKTEHDHQHALTELTTLLESEPAEGSDDAERAEILATLIEVYEDRQFPVEPPTPVEAIRFRMDQLGWAQKDLAPYIGSASKVSEVLNGKRPLTLTMIRKLHYQLGIPAASLIAEPEQIGDKPDPGEYPLKAMHKQGYFENAPETYSEFKKRARDWLTRFFDKPGVRESVPAYARSTAHYRTNKTIKPGAFEAWQIRVLQRSDEREVADYAPGIIDENFLHELASLSVLENAPLLAREFLEKHGIRMVVEPHLPGTYLDGAALKRTDGSPVVTLTLRHDRLDNFWFTLLHELVHIGWHLDGDTQCFFDVLDSHSDIDELETEADRIAADTLISPADWRDADLLTNTTPARVRQAARSIRRHPAIVAGRIRRETGDYRLLSKLIGKGTVRRLFLDEYA